jgi:predicted negative regulator of RcsB-dependent stress response
MLTMLTAPALTFVFLGVVIGLGAALVWALWEIEQVSKSQRRGNRPG